MPLLPVRAYLRRRRLNLLADHPCMFLLTLCAYLHRQHLMPATDCPPLVSTHSSNVGLSHWLDNRLAWGLWELLDGEHINIDWCC